MKKLKSMKKTHKKQIAGTLLFILATMQIINFARLNIDVFPVFYLDFSERDLVGLIIADLNWPFKMLNYGLYQLLGWAALITPLFLYVLGATFFAKRETEKIKRKRWVLLWGAAELAFFIYVVNFISFIILPGSVQPGVVARIFAQYLQKVGGIAFILLFFFWSLLAYLIFVRQSTWKLFFRAVKKILFAFFALLAGFFTMIFNREKSVPKKAPKPVVKISPKQIEASEDEPEVSGKKKSRLKEEPEAVDGHSSVKSPKKKAEKKILSEPTEPDILDVEYDTFSIKEFDTTGSGFSFNYAALSSNKESEIDKVKLSELAEKINDIFQSFGIVLKRKGLTIGPRLVRFEYDFPKSIPLKDIEKHQEEVEHRLGGVPLAIEMPIPGTDRFGIYVGRDVPDMLGLGSYLDEIRQKNEKVPLFLGVAADGTGIWSDATAFPHLLISGTTGSGKSVFLNNIILNFMAVSEIVPVNILLIDPKRVEFSPYRQIPQLSHPIITDMETARSILEEAEHLMERRYEQVTQAGVRNIFEYNEHGEGVMPFLFIVIDEFADLVMQDKSGQIKQSIIRLAQKSRAVGIHIIIATQRPSTDVIDGLIKANFPARIAFKTSSKVDSRIILDENGAENLLGKGDMISKITADTKKRLQGIFIDIKEIKEVAGS